MTSTLRGGGLLRRALVAFGLVFTLFTTLLSPVSAAAQNADTAFYGYFSDDLSSVIMLGEMEFDSYGTAEMMVSDIFIESFFSGFDLMSSPDLATSLKSREKTALADADAYTVYEGMLEFTDGVKPGYAIFFASYDVLYIIIGYTADRTDLFGLAAETIDSGTAPMFYGDYTQMEMD